MSDQPSALSKLFDRRLPINRKERYYTGTVLPMIVASDGFKHFGKFLELCGTPRGVALEADPASSNIQFFTEYGFKESLKDGAEERFDAPDGPHAPDLVVYIEGAPSLLLGIEAKVFSQPSEADVREQLRVQRRLLSIMRDGVASQTGIYQVVLLPRGLGMPNPIDGVSVLTWETVADSFRDVAHPYWIEVLDEALRRYGGLVSTTGGGQYSDAKVLGRDVWEDHKGRRKYSWMGRQGGLSGPELQNDISTGGWKTQRYEVRHHPLYYNRNWFPIAEFIKKIEKG